jgi:V8-like Glu-specific endopeptidase
LKRLAFALLLALAIPSFGSPAVPAALRPLQVEVFSESEQEASIKATICTTTSINTRLGLWLTANHCIVHGPTFVDNMPTVVLFASEESDLAILHTPGLQGIPALAMATEPPVLGQPVHIFGYPMGFAEPQYFSGFVSSLDTHVYARGEEYGHKLMFNMTVCGGSSGSAVLNSRNEVISVLQIGVGSPCATFSGGATWEAMQIVAKYFGA